MPTQTFKADRSTRPSRNAHGENAVSYKVTKLPRFPTFQAPFVTFVTVRKLLHSGRSQNRMGRSQKRTALTPLGGTLAVSLRRHGQTLIRRAKTSLAVVRLGRVSGKLELMLTRPAIFSRVRRPSRKGVAFLGETLPRGSRVGRRRRRWTASGTTCEHYRPTRVPGVRPVG
jgi:hypothetical protein